MKMLKGYLPRVIYISPSILVFKDNAAGSTTVVSVRYPMNVPKKRKGRHTFLEAAGYLTVPFFSNISPHPLIALEPRIWCRFEGLGFRVQN